MASTVPFNRSWQAAIIIATVVLCWALIWWIVVDGDPKNSLHASALAWAFATVMGVMVSLGVGAIAQFWPAKGQTG